MITWEELTKDKPFITDLVAEAEGVTVRYAVWIPTDKAVMESYQSGALRGMLGKTADSYPENITVRHQIVDMGNDLDALITKYGIEQQYIFTVQGN